MLLSAVVNRADISLSLSVHCKIDVIIDKDDVFMNVVVRCDNNHIFNMSADSITFNTPTNKKDAFLINVLLNYFNGSHIVEINDVWYHVDVDANSIKKVHNFFNIPN